ncbi:N-acetylmuramoyl-L-alanine amidase [Haliangium sp.]|uniref:N-acetylmuramoyl-L-alanine amidase n=1 Tax=Haliangium sp. TaxID=2663208 RepID=UPI003D0A2DBA
MSKIWIGDTGFDIDAKVVRWDEGPGYNGMIKACVNPNHPCPEGGTKPYSDKAKNTGIARCSRRPALRRYGERPPVEAVQAVVKQLIVHHDGCADAAMCFNVLHNERGLSCHFLMDNDGTIYQTVDLALMAYHAGGFNTNSIGIEISNRGDAKRDPNYYRKKGKNRESTTVRIHGHIYQCFQFTPAQEEAMQALADAITRALPNVPLEYPQDTPGHQAWGEIPNAAQFAGILGHYHTTRRKWDPGAFDFKALCEKSRGSLCFPIFVNKPERKGDRPVVPDDAESLEGTTRSLYKLNEERAEGGYFPIGAYGGEHESRLWHGGVHLPGSFGQPVYAPFPGRLLAVRMGPDTTVGSANFVLMRHDMTVGTGSIRFYSLYYHLADELAGDGDERPAWLESKAWQGQRRPGQVVLLNEPIEAGAIIGRYGQGGPVGYRRPQIHFEIFALEEVIDVVQQDTDLLREQWQIIDGTLGGRFSKSSTVNSLVDTQPHDGKISRKELFDFFRGSSERALTRNMAVLSLSEWTGTAASWRQELEGAAEFAKLRKNELDDLIDEQVTPTLWWTEAVAKHAELPRDGVVYHYHPLSFVRFINSKLLQAKALAKDGIGAFDEADAKEPPPGVTDDIGDESGESFVSEAELEGGMPFDSALPLEDLVKGFPE